MQMEWVQVITIIVSILVPMMGCFGWLLHKIGKIEEKISHIEKDLAVIKAVLIMRGILTESMVASDK